MTDDARNAAPPKPAKRCPCGHDRTHHLVSAEGEYTLSGYLRLFFGISAQPIKIKYKCRRCQTIFETTTDPAVLELYH